MAQLQGSLRRPTEHVRLSHETELSTDSRSVERSKGTAWPLWRERRVRNGHRAADVGTARSDLRGTGIPAIILLKDRNKGLRIGYGMIVRGEIAFITAGLGLAYGIISESIFSTLVFVILATIFIGPILLRYSFKKNDEISN